MPWTAAHLSNNLTRIQDLLAQGLFLSHSCHVLNLCPRDVWVQHMVVCSQLPGHVMLVTMGWNCSAYFILQWVGIDGPTFHFI